MRDATWVRCHTFAQLEAASNRSTASTVCWLMEGQNNMRIFLMDCLGIISQEWKLLTWALLQTPLFRTLCRDLWLAPAVVLAQTCRFPKEARSNFPVKLTLIPALTTRWTTSFEKLASREDMWLSILKQSILALWCNRMIGYNYSSKKIKILQK